MTFATTITGACRKICKLSLSASKRPRCAKWILRARPRVSGFSRRSKALKSPTVLCGSTSCGSMLQPVDASRISSLKRSVIANRICNALFHIVAHATVRDRDRSKATRPREAAPTPTVDARQPPVELPRPRSPTGPVGRSAPRAGRRAAKR